MILWIKHALSPQQIRDRLKANNSHFIHSLVNYLESVQSGEFAKPAEEIKIDILKRKATESPYVDLSLQLPSPPPVLLCGCEKQECEKCKEDSKWWIDHMEVDADQLAYMLNNHTCRHAHKNNNKNTSDDVHVTNSFCIDEYGNCKARMPRDTFDSTHIDPETGAIRLKKKEASWNTWTKLVTYLIRSNTDVTCMLSGTTVKAVIAYITDYISIPGLKSNVIFDAILLALKKTDKEDIKLSDNKAFARSVIVKAVNCLTSRMEIGSPMSCMYLLGFLDHYTNLTFKKLYWKKITAHVQNYWMNINQTDPVIYS